jgi:hypothetical protein
MGRRRVHPLTDEVLGIPSSRDNPPGGPGGNVRASSRPPRLTARPYNLAVKPTAPPPS